MKTKPHFIAAPALIDTARVLTEHNPTMRRA